MPPTIATTVLLRRHRKRQSPYRRSIVLLIGLKTFEQGFQSSIHFGVTGRIPQIMLLRTALIHERNLLHGVAKSIGQCFGFHGRPPYGRGQDTVGRPPWYAGHGANANTAMHNAIQTKEGQHLHVLCLVIRWCGL